MARPYDGPGRSWLVLLSVVALTVAAVAGIGGSDDDGDGGDGDGRDRVSEQVAPSAGRSDRGLTPSLADLLESAPPVPLVRAVKSDRSEVTAAVASAADQTAVTPPGPATQPDNTPPERQRLIINAVGDVNVDPAYIPVLAAEGYQHALTGMDGLFLDDDLTIINLECPASERGTIAPKQFNFRCDVEALQSLRDLGVDVANQGNNHILDYGPEAMLDSLDQLRLAGIAPVGAGRNAAQAHQPALFDVGGWTIAVVGFGGVVPGAGWIANEDSPGMADGDTIETMVAAVEAAAEVADLVAVTIHWGVELQSGPPPDDVLRAKAMIDAGADMVFGHHPHRLNALEVYKDRPISWSLGNFVWPRLSAAGSDTAVAQVVVEPSGEITACHLPVTIVSHGHPKLDDPTTRSC